MDYYYFSEFPLTITVGSGEDFCELGWVQKFWVGLGFEKVNHDQLCNNTHVFAGIPAVRLRKKWLTPLNDIVAWFPGSNLTSANSEHACSM